MQERTDNIIMNSPVASPHDDGDDFIEDEDDEVFIDEGDIVQEIPVDEEELPEAEDDDDISDSDVHDGADDSIHIFTGHTGELYTVACSPTDPSLVATGGGDDKGFLWSVGQGDWAFELEGHMDSVSSVGFSTDGQLLASGSLDGLVKLWDVSSKSLKYTLDDLAGSSIEWVRWHPRGNFVLAGSEDCSACMWNADKGTYFQMFLGHSSSVTCGDFTPDGKTICTGSDDASMRIWNPRSGEAIYVVRGYSYHTEGLTSLAISSNSTSNLALSGSKDGAVYIVNIETGKVVGSLQGHSDSVECVGVAPSLPRRVATGGLDHKLIVWDIEQLLPWCTCMHEEGVTCLSWLGASGYLATGSIDGKVRIWDSRYGVCVKIFSGHVAAIQSLAVSANGDFLISASIDNTARTFEIAAFK